MKRERGKTTKPGVRSVIESFNYGGVKLKDSIWKDQFDAMVEYYLNIPNDNILKGFRERTGRSAPGKDLGGWYTGNASFLLFSPNAKKPTGVFNTFGQWLGAFARMYKVSGDSMVLEKLRFLLNEWGKAIEKDGYFFYGANPNALHYEFEKTVGGLVDIYEYTDEKESLEYLRRITDWALNNLNRRRINPTPDCFTGGGHTGGRDGDTEWYTLPENLYRAYLLTGDSQYRYFARIWHYEKYWANLAEKRHCFTGLHAYSHINTLSSAAMAYAVSGDKSYLNTIVNAHEILQKTQLFATGGYGPGERMANQYGSLGESLFLQEKTFETPCGSWAAFKLARYLMMFTGEAEYGDWIERLLYNGIGAALPMGQDGKTLYYSDYRVNGGQKKYFRDTWTCCSGTYPLAITGYHDVIYFKDENSLYVNLFVPSEVEWNKSGQSIVLSQDTNFPRTGNVSLKIRTPIPIEFSVKFRIPAWVRDEISVKVNNKPFRGEWKSKSWGMINRTWNDNDTVEIELPLSFSFVPVDKHHPNLAALMYGPVVLVAKESGALRRNMKNPTAWILPVSGQPSLFQTKQTKRRFKPYYTFGEEEKYYVYHNIEE